MFKQKVSILLALLLIFGLAGCGNDYIEPVADDNDKWKIGIITSPVALNEEAYRMAEQMQYIYGEDRILHSTYPNRFTEDKETIITNMLEMAFDPDVQAIIVVHAVPGTLAALQKVRESRPDILIILGFPQEEPEYIAKEADIIFDTDDLIHGNRIVDRAHDLGAEVLVCYSSPRHRLIRVLAEREKMIKDRAEELNIIFIDEEAPDPHPLIISDSQDTGQFIIEDVARKIDMYGPNTAFLATNSVMLEPLIYQTQKSGGITLFHCCPSPYHMLLEELDIEIPEEKRDDTEWVMKKVQSAVAEMGASGRVATWPVPVEMLFVESAVDYAVEWINGNTDGRLDKDKIIEIMSVITAGPVKLTEYSGINNYLLFGTVEVGFSTRP